MPPQMSGSGSAIPGVATAAVAAAEMAVPALLAFNPLFALVLTAIKAHYNATGTWPTEAEVIAAVPDEFKTLMASVTSWVPSGDGSLPKTA